MTVIPCKALIMVVSRTDAIEVAVDQLKPEAVGVILSQDILEPVVMKCAARVSGDVPLPDRGLADGDRGLVRALRAPTLRA
jgi:hypothetical protein